MIQSDLRSIFELDPSIRKETIKAIESRGYFCLGWLVIDRLTFEQNTECQLCFGDITLYCRKSPDGEFLYKSFNTSYSRFGTEHDQKSVIVFIKKGGRKNG